MEQTILSPIRQKKSKASKLHQKALESSWSASTLGAPIPTYDPEKDPFCPVGLARAFNKAKKGENYDKKGLNASASDASLKRSVKIESSLLPMPLELGQDKNISTANNMDNVESELNLLKLVLQRERAISNLKGIFEGTASGYDYSYVTQRPQIMDLIDKVRQLSVELIENVQRWRFKQIHDNAKSSNPSTNYSMIPFKYKSQNYLLKMVTDLNFLDKSYVLVSWLGYRLLKNPFLIPDPQIDLNNLYTTLATSQSLANLSSTATEAGGIDMIRIREAERVLVSEIERNGLQGDQSEPEADMKGPELTTSNTNPSNEEMQVRLS